MTSYKNGIRKSKREGIYLADVTGFKADGSTDMLAIVNDVATDAAALKVPLIFPGGDIALSDSFVAPAPIVGVGGAAPNTFGNPTFVTRFVNIGLNSALRGLIEIDTATFGYYGFFAKNIAIDGNYSAGVRNCIGLRAYGMLDIGALTQYRLDNIHARRCEIGMDLYGYSGMILNPQTYDCQKIGLRLSLANAVTVKGGWLNAGIAGSWGMRLQGQVPIPVVCLSSTDTITSTRPHGLNVNRTIMFAATGSMPSGLTPGVVYYPTNITDATHFQVSTTPGGTAINFTTNGSGVVFYPTEGSSQTSIEDVVFQSIATADANGLDVTEGCMDVQVRAYFENLVGTTASPSGTLQNPQGATFALRVGVLDVGGFTQDLTGVSYRQRGVHNFGIQRSIFTGGPTYSHQTRGGQIYFGNVTGLDIGDGVDAPVGKMVISQHCHGVQGAIMGRSAYYPGDATSYEIGFVPLDESGAMGRRAESFIPNPNNRGAVGNTVRGYKESLNHIDITVGVETTLTRNEGSSLKITRSRARTFTANATTDVITVSADVAAAGWYNDLVVRVKPDSGGTLPGGLLENTDYYVKNLSGATLQLQLTSGGGIINITSAGTGTFRIDPRFGMGWFAKPFGQEVLGLDGQNVVMTGHMYLPSSSLGYGDQSRAPYIGFYSNGNVSASYRGGGGYGSYIQPDKWTHFICWQRFTTTGGYIGPYFAPLGPNENAWDSDYTMYVADLALCLNPQSYRDVMAGRFSLSSRAGMFMGDSFVGYGTAAPTGGAVYYRQGDRIYNTAPTAGGNAGWICTASGAPGTWKQFGVIEA